MEVEDWIILIVIILGVMVIGVVVHDNSFVYDEERSVVKKLVSVEKIGDNLFNVTFEDNKSFRYTPGVGDVFKESLYNITYKKAGNYWWPWYNSREDGDWSIKKMGVSE